MRRWGMGLLGALFAMPVLAAPASGIGGRSGTFLIDEYRGLLGSRYSHPGYRNKGKPARRRSRPNRLHVSRRVRRKHRRSKAA